MPDKELAPHIRRRHELKVEAAQKFRCGIQEFIWIDGELCWLDTSQPVPGVPKVPKPPAEK